MSDQARADPTGDPRALFGAELRRWRTHRGLSQDRLGAVVHFSGDLIAKVEGSTRWPPAELAERCDAVLGTGGSLAALDPAVRQARDKARSWAEGRSPGSDFVAVCKANWEGTRFRQTGPADFIADVSGGATLPGTSVPLRVLPSKVADEGGRRIVDDLQSPTRLLVAAEITERSATYYGVAPTGRAAASPLASGGRAYAVPSAYQLDDLGYAVLWSLTNYDDALQLDARSLPAARGRMLSSLREPELARDRVADVGPIGQMLIGSEFCARHIEDNLDHLQATPVFWTREQRGEEAATWLFFRHKLDYLRRTSRRGQEADRSVRVFCVPDEAVSSSGRPERILLLLTAALMEAHGITVHVTPEPQLSDLPGFATATSGPSIVATWVRSDAVWQVDTTSSRARRREFGDATEHAGATSVIAGPDPQRRMQLFAYYLGLDWRWLRARATSVAPIGWQGFIRPRSAHLSVAGLEQACRFIAGLPA